MDFDDDDHDDSDDHFDKADFDIIKKKKTNKEMGVYFDDTEDYGRTEEIKEQEDRQNYANMGEIISYRNEDFETHLDVISGDDGEDLIHEDLLDPYQQFSNDNEESDPLLDEFVSNSSDLTNSHYNQVSIMMMTDRCASRTT